MRIEGIDLLRGFALLGLPTMNIITFSMPISAYFNPTSFSDTNFLNHFIFSFFYIFSDQKFMGLFSLLFGASLLLLTNKSQQSGKNPVFIHYSRMFWLFVVGMLHGLYLWEGDILALYALLGCLLYPLKNLRVRWLLLIACITMIGSVLSSMVDLEIPVMAGLELLEVNAFYQPSAIDIQQAKWLYQGDYAGIHQYLLNNYIGEVLPNRLLDGFVFSAILRAFSMMCLGMVLFKMRWLQGEFSRSFYRRLLNISLCFAVPILSLGLIYNYQQQWSLASFASYGAIANLIGTVPMVFAYIALSSLFQQSDKLSEHLTRLKVAIQNVGKMALSNYLMQTIICVLLFYGYGLGLYATLSRLQLLPIILLIWAFQLIFSTWWLTHFKQGPIEWVWRMLTYMRWQNPLRRS